MKDTSSEVEWGACGSAGPSSAATSVSSNSGRARATAGRSAEEMCSTRSGRKSNGSGSRSSTTTKCQVVSTYRMVPPNRSAASGAVMANRVPITRRVRSGDTSRQRRSWSAGSSELSETVSRYPQSSSRLRLP